MGQKNDEVTHFMLQPYRRAFQSRPRLAPLSFVASLLFFLVFAAGSVAHSPDPADTDAGPKTFKGRVIAPAMSYWGADWLERPDRESTERPEQVLDALKIAPRSTVADLGAGTGYFSLRLAKRVGPQGRVLATDIQPQMLALLRENLRAADIDNVEPILSSPTDAKLPLDQIDLALMVDVYHELAYPAETIAQVRRALKPDGRLVLVEYRGEDPSVPIKPEHKMTLSQVRAEIEPMGFLLQTVFDFLPHQHIIVFVKNQ